MYEYTGTFMEHQETTWTPVDADGKAVPLLRSPTFNTTDVCMREQTSNLNPRIL